jgi:hypothetical protein
MPWLPVDAGSFWEWQRAEQGVAQMAMVSPFQGYIVSSEAGKLPEQVMRRGVRGISSRCWVCSRCWGGALLPMTTGLVRRDGDAVFKLLEATLRGRSPAIVGKTIWMDAKPYTIIGVLPPSFVYSGAFGGNTVQVWTPVRHEALRLT